MLLTALAILCVTACLGLWLVGQILMTDTPPAGIGWKQIVHGLAGAVGVALAYLALSGPGRGHGAGKFGWTAFILLAGALLGGVTILVAQLRRRDAPGTLIAAHASIAVAGFVLLAAYYTTPISYGR